MLYTCAVRFDMMRNLKKNLVFFKTKQGLNKIERMASHQLHSIRVGERWVLH